MTSHDAKTGDAYAVISGFEQEGIETMYGDHAEDKIGESGADVDEERELWSCHDYWYSRGLRWNDTCRG